jgi:hypothetical protein
MLLALGLAVAFLGAWGLWLSLPGLLLLLFWLALLDFTRLLAVVSDTRRLLGVFVRAVGFVIRHTPALLVLYLLVYLLLGCLFLLFGWGIQPYLPPTWWPLLLLGQQLFILLALAVRLIRLAGGAALVMERA